MGNLRATNQRHGATGHFTPSPATSSSATRTCEPPTGTTSAHNSQPRPHHRLHRSSHFSKHQPHDTHIYKAFSHSSNPGGVTYATDEMQVTTGSNSVPIFLSIELFETFKRVRHLII